MTNEEILLDYMRRFYTDEKLAMLLAHAEDGKLAYQSCCCFIGIPTADHALRAEGHFQEPHYFVAKFGATKKELQRSLGDKWKYALHVNGAVGRAELAYSKLAASEEERRAKLIPLIHAEIERRERARSESSSESLPAEAVLSV